MKRSDAFPTKFLGKEDVKAPMTGIIEKVVSETLGQGEDQEVKPVMYFSSGIPKPVVINNTNWMNVEAIYGEDSDDWTGKPIEVWVDPSVSYGGKRMGGLRLRQPTTPKTGNGTGPADPRQRWQDFIKANSIIEADIEKALGTVKVSEWLAGSTSGATLDDAMTLVLAAKEAF